MAMMEKIVPPLYTARIIIIHANTLFAMAEATYKQYKPHMTTAIKC